MTNDFYAFFDAVVAAHRRARTRIEHFEVSPDQRIRATADALLDKYNKEQLALLAAAAIDHFSAPSGPLP